MGKKSKKQGKAKAEKGGVATRPGGTGCVERHYAALASLELEAGGSAAAGGSGAGSEEKEVLKCLELIWDEAHRDAEGTFRRLKRGGHLATVVGSGGCDEGPVVAVLRCAVVHWLAEWEGAIDPLMAAGAGSMALAALRAHGEAHAKVAEAACGALAWLIDGDGARAGVLFREGAVPLVVAALRAHGATDAKVARRACDALANLTTRGREHEAACEAVVEEGGVPLIVEALRTHGEKDADVADTACAALACLAANSASRCDLLERAGAVQPALAAAKVHGKADAKVAYNVCTLVGWLAKPGTLEGPRVEAMLRQGVREVVADLAAAHGASDANVERNAALVLRWLDAFAARRPCDGPGCLGKGTKRCIRCDRTAYCSRACQVAHWKAGHKQQCLLPLTAGSGGEPAETERPATCDGPGCWRTTRHGGEGGEVEGGALTVCPRCRTKRYCSRECQRAHWKAGHKAECRAALEA